LFYFPPHIELTHNFWSFDYFISFVKLVYFGFKLLYKFGFIFVLLKPFNTFAVLHLDFVLLNNLLQFCLIMDLPLIEIFLHKRVAIVYQILWTCYLRQMFDLLSHLLVLTLNKYIYPAFKFWFNRLVIVDVTLLLELDVVSNVL